MDLSKPWVMAVGIIVALFAIVDAVFGWTGLDSNVLWAIASVFGVSTYAAVRQAIDSLGWKTYALIVINVVPALLFAFNLISAEIFAALTAALGSLIPATTKAALTKAST